VAIFFDARENSRVPSVSKTAVRFTTTHAKNGRPKSILEQSLNQSVIEIITPPPPATTLFLYEKLHVSIAKLETKRSLKVVWTGIHNKEESTHLFLSSKTNTVCDLAEHLSKRVQLSPTGTGRIRVFEVEKDGKTRNEFIESEMIGNLPDPVELFAEEIPRDELKAESHDKVINVFHFNKYVVITHGVPFKFVVKRVSLETSSASVRPSTDCFHLLS
jgi:ubiquitin carboxyl-terminal hydrolase 7